MMMLANASYRVDWHRANWTYR